VNEYCNDDALDIPLLKVDRAGEQLQIDKLNQVRRQRDNREVAERLKALEQAARGTDNLMPFLLDAVNAYATVSEMMDVFRGVFGEYHPSWGF
jgi:methylmalonyl-CoA mutase N-terminal domain/subunit